MGVKTTADECRDTALHSINNAIKNLSIIVVDQVFGWDEFSNEYLRLLQLTLNDLLRICTDLACTKESNEKA